MPNDSGGLFPMPPQDDKYDSTPLTDPVAPILSEPETPVISTPPVVDTTPYEAPVQPADPTPKPVSLTQPPAEPKPATVPPSSKPPVVTLLLIFIAIGAVALTSFFYIQSQKLNSQLNTLSKTLDNQKTTPTPTTTVVITPTLTVTPIVTTPPTPTASDAATPTTVMGTSVWSDISSVMTTMANTYPKAQFLMVDAQYVQPGNELVAKYWFRQDETKKYAYILKDNSKDLSLVDQQVYLTPDNNIPSLNKAVTDKTLGIDFDKAITIAKSSCPTSFDCLTANVSGKYIRTNTTLWQITFKQADKVFVVQIDSLTEKVLYKSQ